MKKYYKAYDDRYKIIHSDTGLAWAGERPSYILLDLINKYKIEKQSSILEIGCGEGQNALYLQQNGYNIHASDVSPEAISWCKEKAKSKKLKTDNYFVLDILENDLTEKFDTILSISTVHMLVPDEDRKAFFDFIYNHLNDNGIAIITSNGDGIKTINNSDISKSYELTTRHHGDNEVLVPTTSIRVVDWNQLFKEIENSSLKVVEHFISTEISGFANSMVAVIKKA